MASRSCWLILPIHSHICHKCLHFCNETTSSGFKRSQVVLQAIAEGWLQVRTVFTIPNTILSELDDGEREVIALVLETRTQQVLLDEREAHQVV